MIFSHAAAAAPQLSHSHQDHHHSGKHLHESGGYGEHDHRNAHEDGSGACHASFGLHCDRLNLFLPEVEQFTLVPVHSPSELFLGVLTPPPPPLV